MRAVLVLCLVFICSCGDKEASEFQIVDTQETVEHDLRRVTTTVQVGDEEINRFVVERIVSNQQPVATQRPVILSPALFNNQKEYTLGLQPGGGDFENSFAANLAYGGADVFIYSTREALVAESSCLTPTDDPTDPTKVDCSPMAEWGLQSRLDDFKFIRDQIAAEHGSVKPIVGGLSLGALTALAAANQDPNAYAGLLLIEGSLAAYGDPADPATAATRDGYNMMCDTFDEQIANGQVFQTDFATLLKTVLGLSVTDPDGASPVVSGLTNRQAFLALLGAPSQGPPASLFRAGLVLTATSVPENKFVFASEDQVNSTLLNANVYTPTAEERDIVCALAGADDSLFTANLKAFTGPVLAFEAELGVGAEMKRSLDLLGSTDIQVQFDPGYGHTDLFTLPDHKARLEDVIVAWMAQH